MLSQLIFRKYRRAVSPIIAMLLVITLAIAGATVVIAILNANLDFFTPDEENVGLGSQFDGNDITPPNINVTGIERSPDLVSVGSNDYVKITVDVTNVDSNSLYVMDIDVSVYGQKLDDVAPWSITAQSGATYTTSEGVFSGYLQPSGVLASYTVELATSDISNEQARIPENATFVYEVLYGSQPNLISGSIQREKQSEIIFSPVFYEVAMLHYGSDFSSTTPSGQFYSTMLTLNATNNAFFLYDQTNDSYDYSTNPSAINGTDIAINYDIVILDVWAVPSVIATQLQIIHSYQVGIIMYGSVSKLGNSLAEVIGSIDTTVTEELAGIVPLMYPGTPDAAITDHSYQFGEGSSVVSGLENAFFQETEDDSWITSNDYADTIGGWLSTEVCGTQPSDSLTGQGDYLGYDIANFTAQPNFNSYGDVSMRFYDSNAVEQPFSGTTDFTLLSEKYNDTEFGFNKSLVFSFIWKENNQINPNAILFDTAHLSQIRINLLGEMAAASERVVSVSDGVTIDSFSVYADDGGGFFGFLTKNRFFDIKVTGTVLNNDVEDGALSFKINMPEYAFHDCTPSYGDAPLIQNSFGSFSVNGLTVVQDDIIVLIGADSTISIDIGDYYSGDLEVGDSFSLELGSADTWMFAIDPNVTILPWEINVKTSSGFSVTKTYYRAVDVEADNIAPDEIDDLATGQITDSSIELTWSEPNDNIGVVSYQVERNGAIINNNVLTTSFTDIGLNSGTEYEYRVFAVDGAGLVSPASNQVNISTITGTPPPSVTNFVVTNTGVSSIELSWDEISNVDGYWIFRDSDGPITIGSSAITSNIDSGLSPSTEYTYYIYAINNSILSATPASVTNSTDNPPPVGIFVSQIELDYERMGSIFDRYYEPTVTFTFDTNDTTSMANVLVNFDFVYKQENGGNLTGSFSGLTDSNGQVSITFDQIRLDNGEGFQVTIEDLTSTVGVFERDLGVYTLNDTNGNQGGNDTAP